MGSQWTDKSAIMRDLSFAQGRWVPGGIDTAVASGKPPTHNITEETEEEYYKRWTADGDFNACPDFSLISQMLEMVQDEPERQDSTPGPIEIKKLNPVAKVFVPRLMKTESKETQQKKEVKPNMEKTVKKKPLRERNVAIASIIANSIKTQPQDVKEVPIKLSKPEDFIKTVPKKLDKEELHFISRRKDSVNKVNSWLQSQEMNSMFKKKSTDSMKSTPVSDLSMKSPVNPGQQYVPSSWADEYYKKCIERTHIRDMVQETVWVQAEKMMKEIDLKAEEQRKQEEEAAALAAAEAAAEEKEQAAPSGEVPAFDTETQGIASVLLPQHRHLLTGPCIVCKVLSKPSDKEILFETQPEDDDTVKPEQNANNTQDEDFFCLVRSSIVENLADIDVVENFLPSEDSTSTVVDISTSDS